MQFEIIEQSVTDWDTDYKSTMMIQISAIPVNYDLIINQNKSGNKSDGSTGFVGLCQYVKGFSYPLIGDTVYTCLTQIPFKFLNFYIFLQ